MEIERKLKEMGYELPPTPTPVANYVGAVRTGNLVFVAGHTPAQAGDDSQVGKLGTQVTIQEGYDGARQCILGCLASLKANIGDLDKVKRIVKLLCMVNCAPDFKETPQVANGASDLLVAVYGDAGRHARSAVGMGSLPGSVPVEIEMIVEVED